MSANIAQLQTLYGLREKTRDTKRTEFAKLSDEVRQFQNYIQQLHVTIEEIQNEVRTQHEAMNHNIAQRQWFSEFKKAKDSEVKELRLEIERAKHALTQAQRLMETKRDELIKSEADLKAVEELIEIERQKLKKIQQKKEEDNADEIAQSRWGKR